jgi:hypothetical protein
MGYVMMIILPRVYFDKQSGLYLHGTARFRASKKIAKSEYRPTCLECVILQQEAGTHAK